MKKKWTYECEAGTYTEDSLYKLLVAIYVHRFYHLVHDKSWMD